MTAELSHPDFMAWAQFHGCLYAGFWEWMEPNYAAQLEWLKELRGYSLDELKDASRAHFRRPNAEKATFYSHQLADLLEILKARRNEKTAGYTPDQAVYGRRCGLCRNHGLIRVNFKGEGLRFVSGGRTPLGAPPKTPGVDGQPLRSASVACRCPAGDKYRERFNLFDPELMELPPVVSHERALQIIHETRANGKSALAVAMQRFLDGKSSARSLAAALVESTRFGE